MNNNKEINMKNKEEMKPGNNGAGTIIGAVAIGAAIGLAVGFLYAPKPGKETRKILKDKALIAKAKASDIIKKSKEVIGKKAVIINDKAGEFIQEVQSPVISGTKRGNSGRGSD